MLRHFHHPLSSGRVKADSPANIPRPSNGNERLRRVPGQASGPECVARLTSCIAAAEACPEKLTSKGVG